METILFFLLEWGATILWITLCLFGIYYGNKEIKESKKDIDAVNHDTESIRYEVASSNVTSSRKNIIVQVMFLLFAILIAYLRIVNPDDYPVNIIRSLVSPILLIGAEAILVSQLKDLTRVRNNVRNMVIEHLKKQGKGKEDIL